MRKLLAIIILAVCATSGYAQAPVDVPSDHWAYEAVRELVEKGYMIGYPDGSFLGNRNLTRYEFAVVVGRILTDLGNRAQQSTQPGVTPAQPPAQNSVGAATPSVSKADLESIAKLVNEFKPELVVIGTRLDKVEADLAALGGDMATMNAILTDPEGAFETMKSDVSKLKKVAVSGYVQARYNSFQGDPDKSGPGPSDNFSVRRARIKIAGKPTDRSEVVVQLDAGQNYAGTKSPSVSLKDAYVGYYFMTSAELGLAMFMGQQKWPFGYEVVNSSGVRETPERSLIVQRLFPGERDRGLMISQPIMRRRMLLRLGVFNGLETGFKDPNDNKDLVGSLRMSLGDVELGVSGYFGKGVLDSAGNLYYANRDRKTRWGVDAQWYMADLSIKAEYIRGRGVDGGDPAKAFSRNYTQESIDGYWAQAAYMLTRADELVAKYESMSLDPKSPTLGERSAWNLGYIRWMDDKTRFKLFYILNKEEKNAFDNNAFIAEWITTF